jgi:hypothetical protein
MGNELRVWRKAFTETFLVSGNTSSISMPFGRHISETAVFIFRKIDKLNFNVYYFNSVAEDKIHIAF